MSITDNLNTTLGEATFQFLSQLSPDKSEASQAELNRFVRWYGAERSLVRLTAHEIANYAERLSLSDTDQDKKLAVVRAFLSHAKKQGWCRINLAAHLKAKKTKSGSALSAQPGMPETIHLTPQGYAELKAELATLKSKRPELIEETRRAAADKDFKENAPLAAAREKRGHLEGRIKELEETLKVAAILNGDRASDVKVNIGDRVTLFEPATGEDVSYVIVSPTEVDPLQHKISFASPIGKALVGGNEGDEVDISVPAGKLHYRIKRIEHHRGVKG